MILGLEIGMLIAGIMALATGKFKVSNNRVAHGVPARVAGLILFLPLPLAISVGFTIGVIRGVQGKPTDDMQLGLALAEAGIAVACLVFALLLAYAYGVPPAADSRGRGASKKRSRREDRDEDEFEDDAEPTRKRAVRRPDRGESEDRIRDRHRGRHEREDY